MSPTHWSDDARRARRILPGLAATLHRGQLPLLGLLFLAAPALLPSHAAAGDASPESPLPHTRLERSSPTDGETLAAAPGQLELDFSAAVEPSLTRLVLRFPTGDSALLRAAAVAGAADRIRAELPELEAGRFSIEWSTVSVDGHRVRGTIAFTVAPESGARGEIPAGPDDSTAAVADDSTATLSGDSPGSDAGFEAEAPPLRRTLFRGVGLACLLASAGLLWFAGGGGLVREPSVLRAASATALLATVLLGLDYLDWLVDVRPTDLGLFAGFAAAIRTRIGVVEGSRVLLAGLVFFLVGGARAGRIAGFLAMTAVVIGAASGHPAIIEPSLALPANALHLGAAAIWIGGVLLLTVLPDHPETAAGGWRYVDVAGSVSSRAFLAVGVIIGTAVLQDLVFLGSIDDLISTTYGRLLLAKGAGLSLLIGFGAWHRWKTLPRLVDTGDPSHLRLAVRIEILVLTAVVVIAAWLALVTPPAAG
jgi:copper transport protein